MTNFSSQNNASFRQQHRDRVAINIRNVLGGSVTPTAVLATGANGSGAIIRNVLLDGGANTGFRHRIMVKTGTAPTGIDDTTATFLFGNYGQAVGQTYVWHGALFVPSGFGIYYATSTGTFTGNELLAIAYEILP